MHHALEIYLEGGALAEGVDDELLDLGVGEGPEGGHEGGHHASLTQLTAHRLPHACQCGGSASSLPLDQAAVGEGVGSSNQSRDHLALHHCLLAPALAEGHDGLTAHVLHSLLIGVLHHVPHYRADALLLRLPPGVHLFRVPIEGVHLHHHLAIFFPCNYPIQVTAHVFVLESRLVVCSGGVVQVVVVVVVRLCPREVLHVCQGPLAVPAHLEGCQLLLYSQAGQLQGLFG
mmetsp:Transcript_14768/g.21752  ORF Transcript_14768/g.21752 Transcript_14768/m.21752 type:complete len:231 (-) Transcript_14768:574-1266(-)